MSYLLLQMLLYMLGAFLLGLLLGWIIWGRWKARLLETEREVVALRAERDRLRLAAADAGKGAAALVAERDRLKVELAEALKPNPELAGLKAERDRLKAEIERLKADLEACGKARADLERRLDDARAAKPVGLMSAPATPARPDDLRQLIGIGPKNEKLLNEQGVTTFAQIASWTAEDVKRIEEVLAFDGRIERERWIEQARYLAAGDAEGFAKAFPNAAKDSNS